MELFLNAYNYAASSIWKDDTPDSIIFATAKEAFKSMKKNCTHGRRFFRLAGQSGSGKTSQLLGACYHLCKNAKIRPLHIAVRNFAGFYPYASALSSSPNFREISNGFALKVLICVLKQAFEEEIDIILEIALLDKSFEKYIFSEIEKRNYFHLFQILSVNKTVSDGFIKKRQSEVGRITSPSSSEYFFSVMPKTFKFITRKYDGECVVWSAFDAQPVYFGPLKDAYKDFRKTLDIKAKNSQGEKLLLEAKKIFLEEQYLDEIL